MLSYLHLPPMAALPPLPPAAPLPAAPFYAMVVAETQVAQGWRRQVCDWLAAAGCRVMSAWGVDGSAWDDAMDDANIDLFFPQDIPTASFILTTWHSEESLPAFFDFCRLLTTAEGQVLPHKLLLHIGELARREVLLAAWHQG